MKRLQAVVFDMDDTLYPEIEYVLSGFKEVATWSECHLRVPADTAYVELQQLFRDGLRGKIFDTWLSSHNFNEPALISTMVQVYREHVPAIRPFPEIPSLLRELKTDYRLGLLSDGWLAVQQRKLKALGLAEYFECIVFSDEWGRENWKPNVSCFRILLEKLALSSEEVVYVGDNPSKDFLGARKFGLLTIWVRRPGLLYTHLEPASPEHKPDISLSSMAELAATLGSVCARSALSRQMIADGLAGEQWQKK